MTFTDNTTYINTHYKMWDVILLLTCSYFFVRIFLCSHGHDMSAVPFPPADNINNKLLALYGTKVKVKITPYFHWRDFPYNVITSRDNANR